MKGQHVERQGDWECALGRFTAGDNIVVVVVIEMECHKSAWPIY
ncbi:MAG: hypothetical protein ACU4EQ_12915 [Candidatus Nitrosoglobus sp.]